MTEKTKAAAEAEGARVDEVSLIESPQRFFNREVGWLEFNSRVLDEAGNPNHPLMERVRFLSISGSNLDEFFMIRMAGLRALARKGVSTPSQDGLSPREQIRLVSDRANEQMNKQQALWLSLLKEMRAVGVHVLGASDLNNTERDWLAKELWPVVGPTLTPRWVNPALAFPFIPNLGFTLAVELRDPRRRPMTALVPLPSQVDRFIELPCSRKDSQGRPIKRFIALEAVIELFLEDLFRTYKVEGVGLFRVVRDSDIEFEEEAEDLVGYLENVMLRRRRGDLVRVKITKSTPASLRQLILEKLRAEPLDVSIVDGLLGLKDIKDLIPKDRPELAFSPYEPRSPERLRDHEGDVFAAIRAKDILVHHPYESFDVVVRFLQQAAEDPAVKAIKQTLYRTTEESPIVEALCAASDQGKNVTALVEVKARFDEETNINLARELELHNVQVVYGFREYKTHAKLSLVMRREGARLVTYTHVGTGNYHPLTARVYTDLSLFTANAAIGRDAGAVFNYVTGNIVPQKLEKFALSPHTLKSTLVDLIEAERRNAKAGKPSGVWAKMNSLVHPEIIDALYRASQAGVPVDLVVRGICCLRPGVPGLSENIRVRSIVGRFLEHSRICCFASGVAMPSPKNKVFISSADWMPRNLDRRVEVLAPIENATVHQQILNQIMLANLKDETNTWTMNADGGYDRVDVSEIAEPFSAHEYFMNNPSLSGRGRAIEYDPPAPLVPEPARG